MKFIKLIIIVILAVIVHSVYSGTVIRSIAEKDNSGERCNLHIVAHFCFNSNYFIDIKMSTKHQVDDEVQIQMIKISTDNQRQSERRKSSQISSSSMMFAPSSGGIAAALI